MILCRDGLGNILTETEAFDVGHLNGMFDLMDTIDKKLDKLGNAPKEARQIAVVVASMSCTENPEAILPKPNGCLWLSMACLAQVPSPHFGATVKSTPI